jgi:hypothetical protein
MVWCQSNGCSTEEDIKYIEEEFFVKQEESFTDDYCEWLRLKNIWCGDDETLREYKKELAGFGTQYHDGTGFADCDEDNTGWRKCKDEPNKNKWCSECVYLDTSADLN